MKLSQLFSGDAHAENVAHPQLGPAQAANVNRQIRSLVPGQTISGEVLSRNGGEVQIKVAEDLVLNARVDRNMNIEVGKTMTFEVKNNGSSLTLSPLFTNVSTDMNVLKALDMAGLPVNGTSVSMTEQLMQAGLAVNKNMLQQVFRELNSFPTAEISDVVALHKLQLPVNEANIEQMAAYRNLNHQLLEGMDTVLGALPEVFDSMVAQGDLPGAMKLYREVLNLLQESGTKEDAGLPGNGMQEGKLPADGQLPQEGASWTGESAPGNLQTGEAVLGKDVQAFFSALGEGSEAAGPEDEIVNPFPGEDGGPSESAAGQESTAEQRSVTGQESALVGGEVPEKEASLPPALRAALAREAMELLDGLKLPEQLDGDLRSRIMEFGRGQAEMREFFTGIGMLADLARTSEGAMRSLERLFSGQAFREALAGQFKNLWTLSPQELARPGKVEEMYRRLDRQLKGMAQALENAHQSGSGAFRAVSAMSRNVDFLQQVNQLYAYVQLPLRLQHRDAHGELYVYTNKKNLAGKEGTVSALLHLDMEHLGPVDVYVTLQSSKVNTKFYLRDDEMIDFVAAHMEILTQRLKKRGYDCSYAMTLREKEPQGAAKGGISPILQQEKGVVLSQYAFDVRT